MEICIIYAFQKIKHFFHLLKLKWGGMPIGGIQAHQRQVYSEVRKGVWSTVLSSLIVNYTVILNQVILSLEAE